MYPIQEFSIENFLTNFHRFALFNYNLSCILKINVLHDLFTTALVNNRNEFIILLLENGLDLTNYLTLSALIYLYENSQVSK